MKPSTLFVIVNVAALLTVAFAPFMLSPRVARWSSSVALLWTKQHTSPDAGKPATGNKILTPTAEAATDNGLPKDVTANAAVENKLSKDPTVAAVVEATLLKDTAADAKEVPSDPKAPAAAAVVEPAAEDKVLVKGKGAEVVVVTDPKVNTADLHVNTTDATVKLVAMEESLDKVAVAAHNTTNANGETTTTYTTTTLLHPYDPLVSADNLAASNFLIISIAQLFITFAAITGLLCLACGAPHLGESVFVCNIVALFLGTLAITFVSAMTLVDLFGHNERWVDPQLRNQRIAFWVFELLLGAILTGALALLWEYVGYKRLDDGPSTALVVIPGKEVAVV